MRRLVLAAVALLGIPVVSASAQVAPSRLANEGLWSFPAPSSFAFHATCNPTGISTITYEIGGVVRGATEPLPPYPGTFTVTGTITIGPQRYIPPFQINNYNNLPVGYVKALSETFSISAGISGATHRENRVVPRDTFAAPPHGWFSWGQCVDSPTTYGPQAIAFGITGGFAATLPDGAADAGVVFLDSRPQYGLSGQVAALAFEERLASGGCRRPTDAGTRLLPC